MFGDYIYMWIISLLSDKLRSTPFVLPNLRLYGTPVDINVNEIHYNQNTFHRFDQNMF